MQTETPAGRAPQSACDLGHRLPATPGPGIGPLLIDAPAGSA